MELITYSACLPVIRSELDQAEEVMNNNFVEHPATEPKGNQLTLKRCDEAIRRLLRMEHDEEPPRPRTLKIPDRPQHCTTLTVKTILLDLLPPNQTTTNLLLLLLLLLLLREVCSSEYSDFIIVPIPDNNRNRSESLLPQRHKRLRKEQKRKMTNKQLDERRKEANKKNSKNYNKNKKEKEQKLAAEMDEKSEMVRRMRGENQRAEGKLHECYECIRTVRLSVEEGEYIREEVYQERKERINREAATLRNDDSNLKRLHSNLRFRRKKFEDASKDIRTKRTKTNTYGSRKSRALHSMNIAKHEYEVIKSDHEIRRLNKWRELIKCVKRQLSNVLKWTHVPYSQFVELSTESRNKIDQLIEFLKRQNRDSESSRSRS
ncbi:unnamed protein product [Caenorhabditis sp. 36 PRJEB53466]|nr:unnamed protein product [Caenorhabditis sp. 36 PRJEB53466]